MANIFATLAKKATTLSPIMEDREKLATKDVIAKYPDGITVMEFDVITTTNAKGEPKTYPVIAFNEDSSKFIYGGKALMDIVTMWIANFEGDIEATSNALKAAGGVKVRMYESNTKAGRTFTKIEVVG